MKYLGGPFCVGGRYIPGQCRNVFCGHPAHLDYPYCEEHLGGWLVSEALLTDETLLPACKWAGPCDYSVRPDGACIHCGGLEVTDDYAEEMGDACGTFKMEIPAGLPGRPDRCAGCDDRLPDGDGPLCSACVANDCPVPSCTTPPGECVHLCDFCGYRMDDAESLLAGRCTSCRDVTP